MPKMNFINQLHQIERIHKLIQLKATGTPDNLATRLGVCKRQLYRYLSMMKELGAPIRYNSRRQCYEYTYEVEFLSHQFHRLISPDDK